MPLSHDYGLLTVPVHAFYGARVDEFMEQSPEAIAAVLARRASLELRGNQPEQARAWSEQVALMQRGFGEVPASQGWHLLLDDPLRRLGRRPDAVILAPGVIMVIEFKMGAEFHSQSYVEQAQDYALCIRDFHRSARGYVIAPIICAEHAPPRTTQAPVVTDFVGSPIFTNGASLGDGLRLAASISIDGLPMLSWRDFDSGGYNPTPTIVEAARAVYAGHFVAEIGRSDAEGEALQRTAERLRYWAREAQERKEHLVCLVSGTRRWKITARVEPCSR
jgi:hypothetical protein